MWEAYAVDQPQVVCANMRAYNQWIVEFCSIDRRRLYPVGQVTLLAPEWTIGEIEQLARADVRVVMARPVLSEGRSLADRRFDNLLSCLESCNMSLAFHIGAFGHGRPKFFDEGWYPNERDGPASSLIDALAGYVPGMLTLSLMIRHGVFERHPALRIGLFELGAGWLPRWLEQFDSAVRLGWVRNEAMRANIRMLPSEYVRRHVWVTAFDYDDIHRCARELGADRILFSTDFPHPESSANPLSTVTVLDAMQDVPLWERVTSDNPQHFFGNPG
jgi:predicted TIM-barrel fold metal-dependent hydrolase